MGWFFGTIDDRQDFLQDLLANDWVSGISAVQHRVSGNRVWVVVEDARDTTIEESGQPLRFINLYLIAKGPDGAWGYNSIPEHAAPSFYDCPLSLFKLAPQPLTDHAEAWREKVRTHHAAKRKKPAPRGGMVLNIGGAQYELKRPCGPRLGWEAARVPDGSRFRIPARQLNQALMNLNA